LYLEWLETDLVSTNTETGTKAYGFTRARRVDIEDGEDSGSRNTNNDDVFYVKFVSRDVIGGDGNSKTFNDVLDGLNEELLDAEGIFYIDFLGAHFFYIIVR
jgi:hypothetical protein